jgi:hypothetical protein
MLKPKELIENIRIKLIAHVFPFPPPPISTPRAVFSVNTTDEQREIARL